ncbi:hypothetical protein QMS71_21825, partial [Cronobacter sakazakii]|nr:hypothetical protein [Cronobacter sakazakii]
MSTISNERLEEMRDYDTCVRLDESAAMARELLALRKERERAEPVPQLENLEHFIAFWRKVQSGAMSPSKNEINYTVWFLEKLADIAAPPAPVVPDEIIELLHAARSYVKSCAGSDGHAFGVLRAIDRACRAAMLNQSQPVAETDTTPQQFESLAGKAVVTEGWKLVPAQ